MNIPIGAIPCFDQLTVRGVTFRPALFCAPLAGLTHSAFRRVVAEMFGGCGAFYTEMLSGKAVLREDARRSPYLKRSAAEPRLIFQLMLAENDPVRDIVALLEPLHPDGIDLNLGCHAPLIRRLDAGTRLYDNERALRSVLCALRESWPGLLSVKLRLGREQDNWQKILSDRLKLFEECGVDLLVVHPRFFEDKFKRRARHELFPWIASLTSLPIVANGDIRSHATIKQHPAYFACTAGLMIGRIAVVQPWIFASWHAPVPVDYRCVWESMFKAITEDFPATQALGRLKMFTHYYARNFRFGHNFAGAIQNAPDLNVVWTVAQKFFDRQPEVQEDPPLGGL